MREYEYELRKDGAVIATGRIQLDTIPAQGEELSLGASTRARVESVLRLGSRNRVILEQL
jgi:hypothetical protein